MARKSETVPGEVVAPAVEEFCTKPYFDEDGVQVASGIGLDGKEYPDPVPFSVPVGYVPPPDLMDMIRRMVHSEMAQTILKDAGIETIDEADDFDIEDDPLDPLTPYERVFLPPASPPAAAEAASAPSPAGTPTSAIASATAQPVAEGAVASPPPGNSAPKTSTPT